MKIIAVTKKNRLMGMAISGFCIAAFLCGTGFAGEVGMGGTVAPSKQSKAGAVEAKSVEKQKVEKQKGEEEKAADMMSGWLDKWPDGTICDATMEFAGGVGTIRGTSKKNSYGGIYKNVSIDMDKTPCLVIDVKSATGFWYIIAKSEKIQQGYSRIQFDTDLTGQQFYDMKAITGLAGMQQMAIELGVSNWKQQEPNEGKSMIFRGLKFVSKSAELVPGAIRSSDWIDKWPDGKAMDSVVKIEGEKFTVVGRSKKMPYGSVKRVMSVNLDKTPILKITPVSVSAFWYLEAAGGALKAPVKIQKDSDLKVVQSYNLKKLLGLSGEQSFELLIGISTGKEDEPNEGKTAVFKDLCFVASGEEKK